MNTNPVYDRVFGAYPLSIATSLAIEGSMGKHPDRPDQTEVLLPRYDVMWVNLKTIFRNLYNAIDRNAVQDARPQDLFDAFTSEIEQLISIIRVETSSKMDVVLYTSDYAGMDRKYRHAILRGDTTHLQIAYSKAMVFTVGQYIKTHRPDVKLYTLKINDLEKRKALMLTHYAYDMLAQGFDNLSLLESHTGSIKDKFKWYTKYYNGKDLPNIPWRESFLQVFGDNEHFRPMSIGIRKQILQLAEQYQWAQITTDAKISYCLDKLQDKALREMLREL